MTLVTAGCTEMCGPSAKPGPTNVPVATTEPPPIPPLVDVPLPGGPDTDVFTSLVGQRGVTPSLQDVAIAARYYCSTRAKLPQFVSRDLPPELMRQGAPSYDLITYRCVEPPAAH